MNWVKARAEAGDTRQAFKDLYDQVRSDVDQVMQLEPVARSHHGFDLGEFSDIGDPSFFMYASGLRGTTSPTRAIEFRLVGKSMIEFNSDWLTPKDHSFQLRWDYKNARWAVMIRDELCAVRELSHFALFSIFFQWPIGTPEL